MQLVLASNNAGKLREFSALLAPLNYRVVPQSALGVSEAAEPYDTFVENALAKARHAAAATGSAALADDSGLCVPALGGAPGCQSARYGQHLVNGVLSARCDATNNARVAAELQGLGPGADRRAFFVCVLVWVQCAADPTPIIAEGRWWGEWVDQPSGAGGFGYDPHFWLPAQRCTSADLPAQVKNHLSHRGQATAQLLAKLAQLSG